MNPFLRHRMRPMPTRFGVGAPMEPNFIQFVFLSQTRNTFKWEKGPVKVGSDSECKILKGVVRGCPPVHLLHLSDPINSQVSTDGQQKRATKKNKKRLQRHLPCERHQTLSTSSHHQSEINKINKYLRQGSLITKRDAMKMLVTWRQR